MSFITPAYGTDMEILLVLRPIMVCRKTNYTPCMLSMQAMQ